MKMFFGLDPSIVFLNHGSYGTTSNPVMQALSSFNVLEERNSQAWFDNVQGRLPLVRRALAQYIDVPGWDGDSVALVASASDAVNAVLRSLLNNGDKVLITSWTYGMTVNTLDYLNERGLNLVKVTLNLTLPTTNAALIAAYDQSFEQHPDLRMVIVDHITSGPAVIFPLKEIQTMARARNITVLTDGAHAVGHIPLSMQELDPDIYLSNIHKWLCGAKATAFLYVRANLQPHIHPTIVSHNYGQGFAREFSWTGTRSYSAHLSIPAALSFRNSIGEIRYRNYNNHLCRQASALFFARWNVSSPVEDSMSAAMSMVPIPCNIPTDRLCYNWTSVDVVAQLTEEGIWAWPNYITDGASFTRYVRLSCQIYNELSDYQVFFEAFTRITGTPTVL
jgi:isopenicillin-N epimerase